MTDPQNSEKLSVGGARTADGFTGDKPGRRRSRRGRKNKAADVSANPGGAAAPQADGASATDNPPPKGKRKKRRRGKRRGQNLQPQAGVSSGAKPDHNNQNTTDTVANSTNTGRNQPGSPRKSKRRRRRNGHNNRPSQAVALKSTDTEQNITSAGDDKPRQTVKNDASRSHEAQTVNPPASDHQSQRPRMPQYGRGRSDYGGKPLYAALDLGTNNCRLLIAQPTRNQQFRVVDGFSRIVRLGEGLAATGSLSPEAMDRAVEALGMCAQKLKGRNVRRMRLIATEACRSADNGEAFLNRVRRETGLSLEIINRETEAKLAVSSCASLIGRETRAAVLFDIGGGSSEIAVIRLGENRSQRIANHISHWTSLPVGVVTLSERYGGHDVTPAVFEKMVSEVESLLSDFNCPAIEKSAAESGFHLIGTSGTVTTLAGVHLDLPRYDRRKVDGIWLSNDEVSAMQNKLLSWDFAGRAANPCIGPDRADLVLAGCAILEAIRRRWPAPRMRVADRGLREGILTDLMMRDGVWRRPRRRHNNGQQQAQNKD